MLLLELCSLCVLCTDTARYLSFFMFEADSLAFCPTKSHRPTHLGEEPRLLAVSYSPAAGDVIF